MTDCNLMRELAEDYGTAIAEQIDEILKYEFLVELSEPVYGYWDGGAKKSFTFTPKVRRYTEGPPNIEWGSWEANFWFRQDLGRSPKAHLATVKRKLQKGKPARTVAVQLRAT